MKILFATYSINETGGGISSYAVDFISVYQADHDFLVLSNDTLDKAYSHLCVSFDGMLN